ncbi:MAG TPA: hypothetical protein DD635_01910 [Flavobacteriales bacterium]|nr:hypothetical protein [Flavobacteriales bacterium]
MSGILPSDSHSTARCHPTKQVAVELQWKGTITNCTTDFVMQWMETRLDTIGAHSLQKKRIIRVAIELLQNMYHHALPNGHQPEFIIYTTSSSSWQIEACNAIDQNKLKDLEQTWESLKTKHQSQLRSMQREKLAGASRSNHGGGGVGLNEILRKANGQVDLSVENKAEAVLITFLAEIHLKL